MQKMPAGMNLTALLPSAEWKSVRKTEKLPIIRREMMGSFVWFYSMGRR